MILVGDDDACSPVDDDDENAFEKEDNSKGEMGAGSCFSTSAATFLRNRRMGIELIKSSVAPNALTRASSLACAFLIKRNIQGRHNTAIQAKRAGKKV